jgi:hypothetical protein
LLYNVVLVIRFYIQVQENISLYNASKEIFEYIP